MTKEKFQPKHLTKVMGGRDYKKLREDKKAMEIERKEREQAEKERQAELKDTLGDKIPKFAEPIPVAYKTFDDWRRYYKVNKPNPKQKNAPGFGLSERFGLDEKAKYRREILKYNEGNTEGKELDPKADPVPGPGAYNLSEVWKGKKTKLRRPYSAQPQPGQRIMSAISKGPTISAYYRK